jgi:hypothetical protein
MLWILFLRLCPPRGTPPPLRTETETAIRAERRTRAVRCTLHASLDDQRRSLHVRGTPLAAACPLYVGPHCGALELDVDVGLGSDGAAVAVAILNGGGGGGGGHGKMFCRRRANPRLRTIFLLVFLSYDVGAHPAYTKTT